MATVEEKRESIYRKMKKLQAYREVENLMGDGSARVQR